MLPDSRPVVEAQLQRILASKTFANAERLRQLLHFLVSESLDDRRACLKETVIGTIVFKKDASYDNRRDALVRTTASRLRKKLQAYYQTEGRSDTCLIELPPDGYIPKITLRSDSQPEQEAETANGPAEDSDLAIERDRDFPATRPDPSIDAYKFRLDALPAVALGLIVTILLVYALTILPGSFRGMHPEGLLVTETGQITDDHLPKRGPVLFDGRRIWFEEEREGSWKIVSVNAKGGDVTPLQVPFREVQLQDIALDGSALLISATEAETQTLWSWPLLGGAPQVLLPQVGDAAWAPDKRSIAFGSMSQLILASGTAPPSSTAMPSSVVIRLPRWSPGSEDITFQVVDRMSGESRLWLADRLGGHVRPVPGVNDTGEDQARGIWTRDGRYYVFAGGSRTSHDLWVLPGSEGFSNSHFVKASRLTHGPVNWDWPTPSRTTSEIYAMGESIQGKLVSFARPKSIWRPYLGGIPAYEVDFSRDGMWVVYVHYPDHALWKARVDGSQRVQLTSSADFEAHQPHWSPDGTRIAFMGQRPGARWRVMILKPGGNVEEPLPEGENQGVPTWYPDGRNLVFGDWPSYGKDSRPMGLHILDLFTRRATPMEGSEALWTPRWSPDGAYISALRQNSKALMLTGAGKFSWREVMTGEELDDPTWSSDSRHIYLTAQTRRELRRVDVLTGKVDQLADLRGLSFTREQWFGVAPDGSPLALLAFPEQEIYRLRWMLP